MNTTKGSFPRTQKDVAVRPGGDEATLDSVGVPSSAEPIEIDITDRLGYTLLKKGIVDYETLEKALQVKETEESRRLRRNLAQILVNDFGVDHDAVYREVAHIYAFREIRLVDEKITKEKIGALQALTNSLPDSVRDLLTQQKILPYKYDERQPDKLIILAADPTDRNIPAVARALNVKRYEVAYVRLKDMESLIAQVLPPENEFLRMLRESESPIEAAVEEEETEALDEEELEAEISRSALVNLIEGALVEAVRRDASDIHIVPRDARRTDFYFRIDGNLQLWHTQENTYPEAISAVVKDRSKNVDRFERDAAQDGFITRRIDNHLIRYRVSILPIVNKDPRLKHESIDIRVLDDRKVITDLDRLGLSGKAREAFEHAISKPQGIVIITGPTGSGKSTTLVAALNRVIDPTVNVLTVEDPVEYIIYGARQLRLGPKMDFEQALRSILRHDPDIVLVGEIRDRVTADIAVKLANTGHLTFTTLHTNDAPSAVTRLYKMGIEPFLIAYAINIVVAQRLVRTLCPYCKRPMREIDEDAFLRFGFTEEEIRSSTFYEPVGCEKCNGVGYKGRIAIFEALPFTKAIQHIIMRSGEDIDEEAIREQAIKEGMLTLRAAGRERMKEGLTTLEEVSATTIED